MSMDLAIKASLWPWMRNLFLRELKTPFKVSFSCVARWTNLLLPWHNVMENTSWIRFGLVWHGYLWWNIFVEPKKTSGLSFFRSLSSLHDLWVPFRQFFIFKLKLIYQALHWRDTLYWRIDEWKERRAH